MRIKTGIRDMLDVGDEVVIESLKIKGIIMEYNEYHGIYSVKEDFDENKNFRDTHYIDRMDNDLCPTQYWKEEK